MATPTLLLAKLLRRSRSKQPISFSLRSSFSLFTPSHHLTNQSRSHPARTFPPSLYFPSSIAPSLAITPYNSSFSCFFSTRDHSEFGGPDFDGDAAATQSDQFSALDFEAADLAPPIQETIVGVFNEETSLPVRTIISLLDSYHDLTGFPWWIVIASSTLALRVASLPVFVLQRRKLMKIAVLLPRLPPPLPPPLSGRSFINQISLFQKEKRALGCPSFLWFFAYFSVQVPCFLLWMASVRKMSLDHHPGFDCGGTLWFQNLCEYPGVVPIFPLLIAGLHLINVQISFGSSTIGKAKDTIDSVAKFYKNFFNLLTLPIFFIVFYFPQGGLVCWLTNSTFSLILQLYLRRSDVRKILGLLAKYAPVVAATPEETDTPRIPLSNPSRKQQEIPIQNLTPRELLALSDQLSAKGHKDRAIPLLRLALDKDPEYVRALVVMGQTLLQNGLPIEATEYFERAISKLSLIGRPSEVEDLDLLIVASQWAGVACIRQGKTANGIIHLERVANLKEPDDAKGKAHYCDGLLLLASALHSEGRKLEAAKYLRMAAASNSNYNIYLEQCEKDEGNFAIGSTRTDHQAQRHGPE